MSGILEIQDIDGKRIWDTVGTDPINGKRQNLWPTYYDYVPLANEGPFELQLKARIYGTVLLQTSWRGHKCSLETAQCHQYCLYDLDSPRESAPP